MKVVRVFWLLGVVLLAAGVSPAGAQWGGYPAQMAHPGYGAYGGYGAHQPVMMVSPQQYQMMMASYYRMQDDAIPTPVAPPNGINGINGGYANLSDGGCGVQSCGAGHLGGKGHWGGKGAWGGKQQCGPACGGCDTCEPRWFDVSAQALFLKREGAGRSIPLSSNDPPGSPDPTIILSTGDIDFDYEAGFRLTGNVWVSPCRYLEVTYFGTHNWAGQNEVLRDEFGDIYSVLSNFGTDPFGGYDDTDATGRHAIAYSSRLDSLEFNLHTCWHRTQYMQSTFLMGFRYVRLDEDFIFQSVQELASMESFTRTNNDLYGFQIGGEASVCLTRNLYLAGDLKAGIYGVRAEQRTRYSVVNGNLNNPSGPALLLEGADDYDAAFVGEINISAIYRVTDWLSLNGGFQMFYLNGVALGTENFNTVAPASGDREVVVNDNGAAFYHGFFVGAEVTW